VVVSPRQALSVCLSVCPSVGLSVGLAADARACVCACACVRARPARATSFRRLFARGWWWWLVPDCRHTPILRPTRGVVTTAVVTPKMAMVSTDDGCL
jgi:hypothetical protein